MPRARVPATRTIVKNDRFNLSTTLSAGLVGLALSLLGGGIVSMINLHTEQATLTQQVTHTQEQIKATSETLKSHIDKTVDRDDYLRRDREVQRAIDKMATKEELHDLRQSVDQQTQMLHEIQTYMVRGHGR